MHAIAAYARLVRRPRTYATTQSARDYLAKPKGSGQPPSHLGRSNRYLVTHETVVGFDCYSVRSTTDRTNDGPSVVYVHGGAYVNEIQPEHWKMICAIVDATGCSVQVPLYGLAPQHRAEQAIDFLLEVTGRAALRGPFYMVGDSSGAGLALATTQSIISEATTPPIGLTLISPWLDIGLTNPAIATIAERDPWLAVPGLRECGRVWSGGLAADDNRVSPIFGALHNLPPIDLYVGDRDIFVGDCRRLRDSVGPDRITYHEQPGAIHVYPLLPVPEGKAARHRLLSHMRAALRLT
ncbi:alpha/beta hydrolase fold domain-containing protein [Mycolicibacterium sp. J2]|uniref:alpha/beta hydrolase fold domain-containing protein n=1 Tax=Mycolicibacterium sp. J2 TaxID=2993511 RepID=UPI00224B3166|nr:alpha/beta hydrolase [Mycolicibacterium sp. J2]MCX2711300.1 alpha/beta hydrolase [Mycolicibacterium sp. J2]